MQKNDRRVELGWLNFDINSNFYKQVRSKYGGGIRHLTVRRVVNLIDRLPTAIETFFPQGSVGSTVLK